MARADFADGYSIDDIYAGGSKDEQGHSSNLRCHVPDSWLGALAELVASKEWPEYKTVQHIIRDAVYHRIKWASNQSDRGRLPGVKLAIVMAEQEERLDGQTRMRNNYKRLREKIELTFREALAEREGMVVREIISDFMDQLEEFPEPYQSRLLDDLLYWQKRAADS